MKKSIKMFLKVMPIVLVAVLFVSGSVFGIDVADPSKIETVKDGTASTTIATLVGTIWSTVSVVIQVLAIAAIVIAGVRYMFASAGDKADIKKQTITLVVGAILVFAAVPLAQLVTNAAKNVIGTQEPKPTFMSIEILK